MPQRAARLYRALVDRGLAARLEGMLLPTQDPFLFTVSVEATAGTSLSSLEAAILTELDRVRVGGVTDAELQRGAAAISGRVWSSRRTASPTSRINSATSRRWRASICIEISVGRSLPSGSRTWRRSHGVVSRRAIAPSDGSRRCRPDQRRRPSTASLSSLPRSNMSSQSVSPVRTVLPNGLVVLTRATQTSPANHHSPFGAGRGACTTRHRAREARASRHRLSMTCDCLTEDFEAVMSLLGDITRHPTFPESEVDRRRGEIATAIRRDADTPAEAADDGGAGLDLRCRASVRASRDRDSGVDCGDRPRGFSGVPSRSCHADRRVARHRRGRRDRSGGRDSGAGPGGMVGDRRRGGCCPATGTSRPEPDGAS